MWDKQGEEIKVELVTSDNGNCEFVGLPEKFVFVVGQLPSEEIKKDPLLAL